MILAVSAAGEGLLGHHHEEPLAAVAVQHAITGGANLVLVRIFGGLAKLFDVVRVSRRGRRPPLGKIFLDGFQEPLEFRSLGGGSAVGVTRRADLGVSVARYGRADTVSIAVLDCLWYGVFGPLPVRMVLVRDRPDAPMLALITTDLVVTAADLVARYGLPPSPTHQRGNPSGPASMGTRSRIDRESRGSRHLGNYVSQTPGKGMPRSCPAAAHRPQPIPDL